MQLDVNSASAPLDIGQFIPSYQQQQQQQEGSPNPFLLAYSTETRGPSFPKEWQAAGAALEQTAR